MNPLYFDAAYVAKCYLNEPDAAAVRTLARSSESLYTSALSVAEVACVFHRQRREGTLNAKSERIVRDQFLEDLAAQVWLLVPVTDKLLHRIETATRGLPANAFLRAGDAIHLVSASDAGVKEIWSNDRHLLASAGLFGLTPRSV